MNSSDILELAQLLMLGESHTPFLPHSLVAIASPWGQGRLANTPVDVTGHSNVPWSLTIVSVRQLLPTNQKYKWKQLLYEF